MVSQKNGGERKKEKSRRDGEGCSMVSYNVFQIKKDRSHNLKISYISEQELLPHSSVSLSSDSHSFLVVEFLNKSHTF